MSDSEGLVAKELQIRAALTTRASKDLRLMKKDAKPWKRKFL